MFPRNGRRNQRRNDNDTRQKQTKKLINFAILNNILNTVNFNDKTARFNLHHKAYNF